MAVAPGTYDMTIQRRSDHTVSVTLKDSGGSAVNLTGYTLASQVWDSGRSTKAADATKEEWSEIKLEEEAKEPPREMNIEVEEVPDDMVKTSHVGYKPKKRKELSPLGFKYNVDLKKE